MPNTVTNANIKFYDIFKDWDITWKRWFDGTYETQLKNVHIGKCDLEL